MNRHNHNQAEYKVMYDLHFESVARYCRRRLPEESAHDAVSETFLTAWRRFESMPSAMRDCRGCTERIADIQGHIRYLHDTE